jgi:hypothetical protein
LEPSGRGVDILALAGQGAEGHLQPDHVLSRDQHAADPVGRPGVVEDRLALLIAGDGVGHDRRVAALVVGDGVAQAVGVEVMLDDLLAAPAGGAAGEVGLPSPLLSNSFAISGSLNCSMLVMPYLVAVALSIR